MDTHTQPKPIDLVGIRQALSHDANVVAAYLTGSQARGDSYPGSDVDIAILFADPQEVRANYTKVYLKYYTLLARYAEIMGKRDLDLVFLQALPIPHQFHALADGELIYTADLEQLLNYREYVYNRYADVKPQLDHVLGDYFREVAYAK